MNTSRSSGSSSEIVHWFQPAIPPVRISALDQKGDRVLAFSSEQDRAKQQDNCQITVADNCLKGIRSSCSIQANKHCKPSWWKSLLGISQEQSWEDIDSCEDQYTKACLARGQPHCTSHALDLCQNLYSPLQQQFQQQQTASSIHNHTLPKTK